MNEVNKKIIKVQSKDIWSERGLNRPGVSTREFLTKKEFEKKFKVKISNSMKVKRKEGET